jgi:hypothetical protein
MSDGGRGRALRGVKVWKSSQKWSVQRSTVSFIAWLDELCILLSRLKRKKWPEGKLDNAKANRQRGEVGSKEHN